MTLKSVRFLLCVTLLGGVVTSSQAFSIDGAAFEFGASQSTGSSIDRYGAVATSDWNVRWLPLGDWYLDGFWEGGFDVWHANTRGTTGNDTIATVHVAPMLRYQRDPKCGLAPFIEVGVGAYGLTDSKIQNKNFSLDFAFGDSIGGGVRFGDEGRFELLYRFQHLSNAGLGDRNPGINFHVIELGFHF